MVTADDVRAVGLALPRAYERMIGGRWKLKVGQIVFCAFDKDETPDGLRVPQGRARRAHRLRPRDVLPPADSDLRYQWVCAHLDRLDHEEMRELVVDAWRMCTPAMLHDLPEMPVPAARRGRRWTHGEWGELRRMLHPYLHFHDGRTELRGRDPGARAPAHGADARSRRVSVEVRDGQIYRWVALTGPVRHPP